MEIPAEVDDRNVIAYLRGAMNAKRVMKATERERSRVISLSLHDPWDSQNRIAIKLCRNCHWPPGDSRCHCWDE